MSDMTLQNSCSCSMENGMRRWLVNISEWNPSEEHFAFLISLFPEDGQRAITRYWSLKEAYVKAIGTGIGYGLHRLEFHHTDWSNIFVTIDGIESRKWKFMLIKLDDKHMASLARGFTQEVDDNLQPNLDYLEESLDALIVADPSFILLRMDDLLSQTLKKVVHGNIFHL